MSRAKRIRKARMAVRQEERAARYSERLAAASEHLSEAIGHSRFRAELNASDVPEPVKFVIGSLIDPVGTIRDMIERQMRRGETGT